MCMCVRERSNFIDIFFAWSPKKKKKCSGFRCYLFGAWIFLCGIWRSYNFQDYFLVQSWFSTFHCLFDAESWSLSCYTNRFQFVGNYYDWMIIAKPDRFERIWNAWDVNRYTPWLWYVDNSIASLFSRRYQCIIGLVNKHAGEICISIDKRAINWGIERVLWFR